jgi:hypothetical protein
MNERDVDLRLWICCNAIYFCRKDEKYWRREMA